MVGLFSPRLVWPECGKDEAKISEATLALPFGFQLGQVHPLSTSSQSPTLKVLHCMGMRFHTFLAP